MEVFRKKNKCARYETYTPCYSKERHLGSQGHVQEVEKSYHLQGFDFGHIHTSNTSNWFRSKFILKSY